MNLYYAGIGSRSTPLDQLKLMTQLARFLAQHDMVLRSGGAPGADSAFEIGCNLEQGEKEIYIPWNGFNNRSITEPGVYVGASQEALAMAEEFHPNWNACSDGAKLLHARNCYQVLGLDLKTPCQFVLCWTVGGNGKGGTGQAIRIAKANNIPVFDMGSPNVLQELDAHLQKMG